MRPGHAIVLGAALPLIVAAPAAAAQTTIVGTDQQTWDKPHVTVAPGDTVVWTFPGTQQVHNVASNSPNWAYQSPLAQPAPDGAFTFTSPGVYAFICQVHSGMTGDVTVTDAGGAPPPPPPPPPPSQQPFPNDGVAPPALETGGLDTTPPKLRNVRVRRVERGARIRFRVSERARVTVRLERGGKVVRTRHVDAVGRERLTVRGKALRAGRYRVRLRAEDVAGNRSGARTARMTIR